MNILSSLSNIIFKSLYHQLASMIIAFLLLTIVYLVASFIINSKVESQRLRNRYKMRVFYVACFLFLLFIARIWLEGFSTIFAVLGLVSAALVVTNKEIIMNFMGFFIIQWRELFTENDHIQIQNYNGYVQKIGILYVTLWELNDNSEKSFTGRVIRIPNGIVSSQAIINYSQTSHFLSFNIIFCITGDSNITSAIELTHNTIKQILLNFYQDRPEYSKKYLQQKNSKYADCVDFDVNITLQPRQEKPFGIQITANYFCFVLDHEAIEQKIWLDLLPLLQQHEQVKLSFNG